MVGKITAILRQKKDKARASIYVEGGFAFGVNEQTIEEFRLRKGDYLSPELCDKIIDFDYWISAKRIALHFINYRARSEKEVRERLVKEEIPDEIIDRVIEFCRGYNLINDEAWAKAFTNDKLRKKSISSRQLEQELRQKGIDKKIIAETVGALNAQESDFDRALTAAQKRWPRLEKEEPMKRRQKLYAFLASRGFAFDVINQVYKQLDGKIEQEED